MTDGIFLGILSGIVYLWKTYVQPSGIIGYAETNMVNVTSLQDALVTEVAVERMTEEELLKGLEGLAPPEEQPEEDE